MRGRVRLSCLRVTTARCGMCELSSLRVLSSGLQTAYVQIRDTAVLIRRQNCSHPPHIATIVWPAGNRSHDTCEVKGTSTATTVAITSSPCPHIVSTRRGDLTKPSCLRLLSSNRESLAVPTHASNWKPKSMYFCLGSRNSQSCIRPDEHLTRKTQACGIGA